MEILKTFKFLTIVLLLFFVVIYILVVSYVYFNQVGMIFQSARLPKDFKFDYQQKFEELNIKSFDGINLSKVATVTTCLFQIIGNIKVCIILKNPAANPGMATNQKS